MIFSGYYNIAAYSYILAAQLSPTFGSPSY
jgi:hypothetical protein